MFDSIKHWFDSLDRNSKLFDHADDEVLHSALASVLYHLISADGHADTRERREFGRMLQQEFGLDEVQVEHLYQAAKSATGDIHGDLHTLNFYLRRNPAVRMTFLRKLLQLIDIEGVYPQELELFYEALHEVFPEARQIGTVDQPGR